LKIKIRINPPTQKADLRRLEKMSHKIKEKCEKPEEEFLKGRWKILVSK
jgi:hypothetical protein